MPIVRPVVRLPGPYRAVVLDLDGLLVQTEDHWSRAKEILFARHGTPYTEADHLAVLGTSDRYTAAVFARRMGLPPSAEEALRAEYLGIADELFDGGVPVSRGARELLGALRGRVPLGLASNTRGAVVAHVLSVAGFEDAFDAVVTGDDGDPKPAPDLYLIACRRLGVAPDRAVALEDSPAGVAAARAAGLTCIGVPSHPGARLDEADAVVASLEELL